jgi:hypothetical protein
VGADGTHFVWPGTYPGRQGRQRNGHAQGWDRGLRGERRQDSQPDHERILGRGQGADRRPGQRPELNQQANRPNRTPGVGGTHALGRNFTPQLLGSLAKGRSCRCQKEFSRLARLGKRQDAYKLLAPVYSWFTEGFHAPDLKDAKALLDELA